MHTQGLVVRDKEGERERERERERNRDLLLHSTKDAILTNPRIITNNAISVMWL